MDAHQIPGMKPKMDQSGGAPEKRRGAPFHKKGFCNKGRPNQAREKQRRWYP